MSPEINHKNESSIPVPPAAAPTAHVSTGIGAVKPSISVAAKAIAPGSSAPSEVATLAASLTDATKLSPSELEEQIKQILKKMGQERAAAVEATVNKEPDWKNIGEQDIYKPDVFIPIIEHDIPDYMNIRLKDEEYVAVWASQDQRRVGQLLAEGYEYIKPDMIASSFKLPLRFSSEGLYIYADVIAMRVHKRIIFSKRKAVQVRSENQLKKAGTDGRVKAELMKAITNDPDLELAFAKKGLGYYDTNASI